MGRRRGFFAELEHQSKLEQKRRQAEARQREVAARRALQARMAKERASAAEDKRLEREAAAAHVASRQAEVDRRNSKLTAFYDEVDRLLEATLHMNHYVDPEQLRRKVDHPPFGR